MKLNTKKLTAAKNNFEDFAYRLNPCEASSGHDRHDTQAFQINILSVIWSSCRKLETSTVAEQGFNSPCVVF